MRIVTKPNGGAEMTAPDRFKPRDLRRIARLARRVGKRGKVWTYRPRLVRDPEAREFSRNDKRETLLYLENEWDGQIDGWACEMLDLIEAAGFDVAVYSCLASGGGYWVQALDDDGEDIETIAWCFGMSRTQAAAGLAVWAERATRPRRGVPRFGPRHATPDRRVAA